MRGLREVLRDAFQRTEQEWNGTVWDAVTETIPISIFRFADIRSQQNELTEAVRFEMGKGRD